MSTELPHSLAGPISPDTVERRERLRQTLRERHQAMLWLCTAIIFLACLLEVRPDQRVQMRWGLLSPLPELCVSRTWFGIECPGCGLTRSFVALSRGQLRQAWQLNRFSWLLAIALLAQFPYRLWHLWQLRNRLPASSPWPDWIAVGLLALLITNWGLRLVGI